MNQNTFCSKCHRIPSQCCCSSVKELTDEEIGWFAKAYTDRKGKLNIIDFARAILRKAQEK
jgi:hypothetical protein